VAAADGEEKIIYLKAIDSLRKRIKIINSSIPTLLLNISLAKELPAKESIKQTGLEEVRYDGRLGKIGVALNKKKKAEFLKELSISEDLMNKMKKSRLIEEKNPIVHEFKKSRGYVKLSNKYFLDKAIEITKKGYFKDLAVDLKKGNFELLFETYVAMMMFTTFISIFAGILIMIFFMFFSLGFSPPFLSIYDGSYLVRFAQVFWIVLAAPALTFGALYIYPSTERGSISKKIDQEIPFAVIHMSAVSGSGIAPVEIFKIIGLSKEYPCLGKEIVKVLNQINLYGYDLGTALVNASKTSSNQRLAELFSGLATTINSGGDMSEFFEKRAETLMLQYRLEREKFAKMAETFMDIYISVVIATPMILMLLLMMISVTGTNIGLGPSQIGLIIVGVIALINVFFLFFLNIKQPSY
jgi:flagellar protein FlaJ